MKTLGIICVLSITLISATAGAVNCLTTTNIGLNQTITSSLDGTECTVNDINSTTGDYSYFDLYKLTLSSTTTVTFTLDSNAFDTYLFIFTDTILTNPQDPSALIAENDDANSSTTNSRITLTLGPGTYIIGANSIYDFETGGYTLRARTGISSCLTTTNIGLNQTITSSLDGTECTISDIDPSSEVYSYFDLYKLTLFSTTNVVIALESSAFDAYLFLLTDAFLTNPQDPSVFIAGNDDANSSTSNSKLTVTLGPGTYIIGANSYNDYVTGMYDIKTLIDTDKDGIPDQIDTDDDNDRMPDSYETLNGFNPLNASDASADADGDGYSNLAEYKAGSDPRNSDSIPRTRFMPWLPLLLD